MLRVSQDGPFGAPPGSAGASPSRHDATRRPARVSRPRRGPDRFGAGLPTPPAGRFPRPAGLRPEPPRQRSLLEEAGDLANRGRHAEAIAACEQHIRLKGPMPRCIL